MLWILLCSLCVCTGAYGQAYLNLHRSNPGTMMRTSVYRETPPLATATYHPIPMRSTSLYAPQVSTSSTSSKGYTASSGYRPSGYRPTGGIRKAYYPGESEEDGAGKYWDEEEEDWLPIPGAGGGSFVGERKEIDGVWYTWDGTAWVLIDMPTEVVPVGDMPWWLFLVLAAGYMFVWKNKKQKRKTMNTRSLRAMVVALFGIFVMGVSEAYATGYTHGRAFLKQGSPTGGGKVYVAANATEPTSGQYKAVTNSTSPAFDVKNSSTQTYHFWAKANPGYIFTGWYTPEGTLVSAGAAHISKSVTQPQAGTSDAHAYADYYASFIKQIQLSFVEPANGSFTISHNGETVTPAYSSFTTEGKVVLTARPADGYKLRGWYTTTNGGATKNYFAFGSTCEPNFTSNVTIGAEFVPDDGKATFWIKGTNKIFDDLNAANTAASSGNIIVVVSDGIVVAGTYSIKSGVTLLIPYNETYDLMTTPKVQHYTSAGAAPTLSAFRKLTLASGVTINVSGNICIGGQQTSVNGGNPTSLVCGPCGVLDMSHGGTINLNSGSNLYAWGFVKGQDMDQGNNTSASGAGQINAASGATVWEDFQCGEWRGGTASSTIYNNKSSWKFFPFQSYTIQNIEVPVTYAYGSNLKCHWAIFGNGATQTVSFSLVASSKSLFLLASGGTLKKWYDPTTDRVCYEVGGTTALNALTLNVMGETVSSADYNLPIPANMQIILKNANLTISKPMTMHAGSVVEIKPDASLTLNSNVYLYDKDDWDTYCMYSYYYRTYNNLSLHYNRGTGTSKATLEDAKVIVDGTLNLTGSGRLYSTAAGSNVMGNGGGVINYGTLPSNTTMVQCKQLSDRVNVNIRSANMHNDNGTYTKGIASTTFRNVHGRWFTSAKATEKANHTYDFTYIKSGDVYGTGGTNATVAACYTKDKTGLEQQEKWVNVKEDICSDWWVGIDDNHLYNFTRNSAWHQYIKTGSVTTGEGEEAVTTDIYAGSDDKLLYKTECSIEEEGAIDEDCLYTVDGVKKALVNGSFIAVAANTSPDHGYHATASPSTYYLCFAGCVWHPATRNDENLYTVSGVKYIWYGDQWLAVQWDAAVSLYYSLSATNVRIYYEYVDHVWTQAKPVAEVTTAASGTEHVYSMSAAFTKAAAAAEGTNVTIRLLKDATVSSAITYTGGNNCGLDLNGYTLTGTVSSMITVNNASATLIIKDQSPSGTGKIQASFSRSDNNVYGLNVTSGHIILNGGTVHIENTHASQGACGVYVYTGQSFTINGGKLEVVSKGTSWGIFTENNNVTYPVVNINGGTIETTSTSTTAGVSGIYGEGGIITINGGTLYTHSESNGADVRVMGINLIGDKTATLTINGGTINTEAKTSAYGVYALSTSSTTTVNAGTISATTTATEKAYGIDTYGITSITGGKIKASAQTNKAYGVINRGARMVINTSDTIFAEAKGYTANAIYTTNATTKKVWVNGGVFVAKADNLAHGLYAYNGTDTVNGGEFLVTATGASKNAHGIYLKTNPKVVVNGGKFKVTASNAYINTIESGGAISQLSMAGGYFSKEPDPEAGLGSGDCIASDMSVKEVNAEQEPAIVAKGYSHKIAGNEYKVTWYDMGGKKLKEEYVESGARPVWTGDEPDLNSATATRELYGWTTGTWNNGTAYRDGVLPAITDHDVAYYAGYKVVYAEVTANGTTSRYYEKPSMAAGNWWKTAMTYPRATIRLMTYINSGMPRLEFAPTPDNAVITLDMNGMYWEMNSTGSDTDKDCMIKVNKSGCTLILTDNSESGAGYLSHAKSLADAMSCIQVLAGDCHMQGGKMICNNTSATNDAIGVNVASGGTFVMFGGTIESKKDNPAVTGGTAFGLQVSGTANLEKGAVTATNTIGASSKAIGIRTMDGTGTANCDSLLSVVVNGATESFGVLGNGTVNIYSGAYDVTASGEFACGIAAIKESESSGKVSVTGKPRVTVKADKSVYGFRTVPKDGTDAAGVVIDIDGGIYDVYSTASAGKVSDTDKSKGPVYGVLNDGGGTVSMRCDSMYVTTLGDNGSILYARRGSITNISGGTYKLLGQRIDAACTYNSYGVAAIFNYGGSNPQINITGGDFIVSNPTCTWVSFNVRAYGGTTNISGDTRMYGADPVAAYGVRASALNGNKNGRGAYKSMVAGEASTGDALARINVDGGEFISYETAITSKTYSASVRGDITIKGGKFKSTGADKPVIDHGTDHATTPVANLHVYGGYFSNNADNTLEDYANPSSEIYTMTSVDTPEYVNGYLYRVIYNHAITWNDGERDIRTDIVQHNTMPSFGESLPVHSGADTYQFLRWENESTEDTVVIATEDVTYTAQWRKIEADVYEGNSTTPIRYEHFADAWDYAQNLPLAKIQLMSDISLPDQLVLNPDSANGADTLTLDLNNHELAYTGTADKFVHINKENARLRVVDTYPTTPSGVLKYDGSYNGDLIAVKISAGELIQESGEIQAKNSYTEKGTRGVDVSSTSSTFTMSGGTLTSIAENGAHGVYLNNGKTNISGSALLFTQAESAARGIYSYGADAKAVIDGGKDTVTTTTGGTAFALQTYYYGKIEVHGGEFKAKSQTHTCRAIEANTGQVDVTGGSFTANSSADASGHYEIETIRIYKNTIVNIYGGTFESLLGHSGNYTCRSVNAVGGTTTIYDGTFNAQRSIYAGTPSYLAADTARVTVHGGTFYSTGSNAISSEKRTSGGNEQVGKVIVNGGYFWSRASTFTSSSPSGVTILNGGYYSYNDGTNSSYATQLDSNKGAKTTQQTLSPKVTKDGKQYAYKLNTKYGITWVAGDAYSRVDSLNSGETPANAALEGKYFVRNDSAFLFTGWSPVPGPVSSNATYKAVGEYYEAEVQIGSGEWMKYERFNDAWDALNVTTASANATIRLLSNVTLDDQIVYQPAVAAARTTIDLNDFTLSAGGTTSRLLLLNQADARLTIADNSAGKSGTLSIRRTSNEAVYAVAVQAGELVMSSGKIYCENDLDDSNSHPAVGVYVGAGSDAKLTMTDGTVQAEAAYMAYAVQSYNITDISGGTISANATGSGRARAVYVVNGTTTITAGTVNATGSTGIAAVAVEGYISSTGTTVYSGTLEISGGTFNASATTASGSVYTLWVNGNAAALKSGNYSTYGTANVSGGTFTARKNMENAQNTYAVYVLRTRAFNSATPHVMLAEGNGVCNITGGTFTAETKDGETLVGHINGGGGSVFTLGTTTISGGTFYSTTKYYSNAIRVYAGKTTVYGSPVFHVNGESYGFGVSVADWCNSSYTDADIANNKAELEINGGTFNVANTSASEVIGIKVNDATTADVAGYAMEGHVTVNGGSFNLTSSYRATTFAVQPAVAVTHMTATPHLTVTGGKFKNNSSNNFNLRPEYTPALAQLDLQGGFYSTINGTNATDRKLDYYVKGPRYTVRALASDETEYGEGYRQKIITNYNLTWVTDGDELTGDYTSGYTELGTPIVAPNTPTKTGYTFAGWSPAVPPTVPAEDTEYTATWTVNSYAIRFLNYDGSVLQSSSVNYGETPVYSGENPSKPADATYTYTFDTWSPAIAAVSGVQDYTAQFSQTANVASVTISGVTTYYATFEGEGSAWYAANSASSPSTIKLLKNVEVASQLVYNNSSTKNCTLDLNGYTLTSTTDEQSPLHINGTGITFTITDGSVGKLGTLSMTSTCSSKTIFGVYVQKGTLVLDNGTIAITSGSATTGAVTVQDAFTMNSGTIHVTTTNNKSGRGVYTGNGGTATINNGTVHVEAAGEAHAMRVDKSSPASTLHVYGGKFNASGTSSKVIHIGGSSGSEPNIYIHGGYYSNTNTSLASYVTDNHALVALTAAEKAVIGSAYNWQVLEQYSASDKLDIVDYSATSVTLNMNGYTSAASKADWKIKAYENTYTKTNRATDRTMEVSIPSSIHADDTIRMDGTSAADVVESRYVYIMPHIFTSDATLDPASVRATSILYVKSGTLTIDANTRVNKVYVCADAKLKINEDVTLTVDTVVLRTKPFHAAELENNGTLTVNGQMYYSRQIADKTAYHEIALPFDVTLANMRFSNGKAATFGTYFGLMEYDGQSRADVGADVNRNWKPLNPAEVSTMAGMRAYQMLSTSAYYYEFYFPVNYIHREDGTEVEVTAYVKESGETAAGNKGWNYLTSPYTHTFEPVYDDPSEGIKIACRIEEDEQTFIQDVATAIKPTTAFYYQTDNTGSLVFSSDAFIFRAPQRHADAPRQTQWLRLHYGMDEAGTSSDVANIYLNDDKFTTAYETGYDVAKWSTDGALPLLWTVVGSEKLAFAALPDSAVAENLLPVTVYNPQDGLFVFSLEQNRYLTRLEHVYLYDAAEQTMTDLLAEDYYCFAEQGTVAGRFFINTAAKSPAVATGMEDTQGAESGAPRKLMINQNIYILMPDGKLYDMTGRGLRK